MASNDLKKRKNWQTLSGKTAKEVEDIIEGIFNKFKPEDIIVIPQPKDLKNIYETVELSEQEKSEIFDPGRKYTHGIKPDFKIENRKSGKSIYLEVKRQDGWVEGKSPSAGRGNAHERSNKLFTPGLLNILRSKTNITENENLPFAVIFVGDITRDPKRVREITLWYKDYKNHFFLWRDVTDQEKIKNYFLEVIIPLIL